MKRTNADSLKLAAFCDQFDRFTAELGTGYWVSMRCSMVPIDDGRPHGLSYSMTLHKPGGARIFGIDNAHSISTQSGPARRAHGTSCFDHVHKYEKVSPYHFRDCYTLLEDFWIGTNEVLRKEGVQ